MSVIDAIRGRNATPGPDGPEQPPKRDPAVIPGPVQSRMDRGRRWMLKDASKRRLCTLFERGDSYSYVNDKGLLGQQSTAQVSLPGSGKPPHRIRNTYNFIRPIVTGKVSAATQRVPSYEILPATTDPEDIGAARLGEKVALYGYDKWNLRAKTRKAVKLAIGCGGEAFALPYFDPNVGPYTTDPSGGAPIGQGEINVCIYGGNQVYWEPGVDFDDSPWWAVEDALPIHEVQQLPGFFGDELTPDANTSDVPTDRDNNSTLVMVTRYFERPCPRYTEGRTMWVANKRVICDYRLTEPAATEPWWPYPLRGGDGVVIDEPVLHRLQWEVGDDDQRDLGLTWQLIDPQRTIQDCWNKLLEWKNRALLPQMSAPRGSNVDPRTDEPGRINYYDVVHNGTLKPEWENVPTAFAGPLFQMLEQMQSDMRTLGFDSNIQAQANVAARTVTAVIEQDESKWQSFKADLADWHSRVMRHCLVLVQAHYSEKRQLAIRGRFGPENIADFTGAKLLGQADVRVLPGSLDYLTRDQLVQRVFAYADRMWITPQQAMIAINGGTADNLVQSIELDVARIDRIIQKIRDNTFMSMPARTETVIDPNTGQPAVDPNTGQIVQQEVPSWMPLDQVDDLQIWKARLTDYAKTEEYEKLALPQQEAVKLILSAIERLKTQQQQRTIEAQNAQAAQLGLNNAAKPQQATPLPNQAAPSDGPGGPPALNQPGPPPPPGQ